MHQLTFNEWQSTNSMRSSESFDCKGWSPTDWGCALAGEVGELCNLLKKMKVGEEITDKQLREEIGGSLAYLSLLAEDLGISLQEAAIESFNDVSQRVGSKLFIGTNGPVRL